MEWTVDAPGQGDKIESDKQAGRQTGSQSDGFGGCCFRKYSQPS